MVADGGRFEERLEGEFCVSDHNADAGGMSPQPILQPGHECCQQQQCGDRRNKKAGRAAQHGRTLFRGRQV